MKYKEVRIKITPFSEEYSDIMVAMIEDLGFESYNAEAPFLSAYIQESIFDEEALKETLESLEFPDFSFTWETADVAQENWNRKWESSFEPVVIKDLCTIKATYHKDLPPTRFNITINPEMAFGTGHHQTTTLMATALLDNYFLPESKVREIKGLRVLDMGCGTGILGILAAMIGADSVTAIDIDDTARDSAERNAVLNDVSEAMEIYCGDAAMLDRFKDKPFDIILANINRNILLNDMPLYRDVLKHGGELYISGFYEEDVMLLENRAAELGLEMEYTRSLSPWAMIKFRYNR